jgi:hypothetical protein
MNADKRGSDPRHPRSSVAQKLDSPLDWYITEQLLTPDSPHIPSAIQMTKGGLNAQS